MSDLYRKVRAVLRKTRDGYYDRVVGLLVKDIYVLDSQGRRVNRTLGKALAKHELLVAKQSVGK